jgi:hypothetical protein
LSFDGLEKERLILKHASEGWHFRLKNVKNKTYLCARKNQEEHSFGVFTNELEHITKKKHQIKIKNHKHS